MKWQNPGGWPNRNHTKRWQWTWSQRRTHNNPEVGEASVASAIALYAGYVWIQENVWRNADPKGRSKNTLLGVWTVTERAKEEWLQDRKQYVGQDGGASNTWLEYDTRRPRIPTECEVEEEEENDSMSSMSTLEQLMAITFSVSVKPAAQSLQPAVSKPSLFSSFRVPPPPRLMLTEQAQTHY